MDQFAGALEFFPRSISYDGLRRAASECRGCDLFEEATQTVFGEGPRSAHIFIIGEVPGDEEDKQGHPFVGPAGRLLSRALADAGLEREQLYLTNAVKHFKWKPAGKRRLHQKPTAAEMAACKPWLNAEIEVIRPKLIVCLGATAAQALLGKDFRVTKMRGKWFDGQFGARIMATIHPSAVLRMPDMEREAEYRHFVADLALIARAVASET